MKFVRSMLVIGSGVMAAALLQHAVFPAEVAAAELRPTMSEYSPSPENSLGNDDTNNQTNHTMILSDAGVVERIRIGLYYQNPGDATVRLDSGGTANNDPRAGQREICRIYNARSYGPGKRPITQRYLIVRFTARNQSNSETIAYPIDGNKMCNTTLATNGLSTQAGGSNEGQAQLFGDYIVPARIIHNDFRDTDSGFIRVTMEVQWADDDTNVSNNVLWHRDGEDQRFQFNVRAQGAKVGSLSADNRAGARNYSFAGRGTGDPVSFRQLLPFGRACRESDLPNANVTLYDADNKDGRIGVLFYVVKITTDTKNDADPSNDQVITTPLQAEEYTPGSFRGNNPSNYPGFRVSFSRGPDYSGGTDVIWSGTPGNGYPMFRSGHYDNVGGSMTVSIRNMEGRAAHYGLVARNILRNGDTGANNFLYAGLPGDGIYGASDFQCPPGGEVLDPDAGFNVPYAVDGQPIDAFARVINNSAPIEGTYRRELWYSVDGDYEAGPGTNIRAPETATRNFQSNVTTLPNWNTTASGGFAYICTRLTIIAPVAANGEPQPMDGQCIPIGKFPNLVSRNGDVRAGGTVPLGACNLSGVGGSGAVVGHDYGITSKGSLSAYGVLGRSVISDFGSTNIPSTGPGTLSKQLMFGAGTAYSPPLGGASDGYFYRNRSGVELTVGHCLPNLTGVYPSNGSAVTVAAGATTTTSASSQTYNFAPNAASQTSTITIPSITLGANQRVSIRVNGPAGCGGGQYVVRLTGNITRTSTNIAAVPWFSLITTGNCVRIVVADNVTSLYGLYATEGDLMTCQGFDGTGFTAASNGYPGAAPLISSNCDQQLTFNGVVIAGNKAHTYRTNGNGDIATPAEVFNLDPAFTISDYNRGSQSPTFQTERQLELPPRF